MMRQNIDGYDRSLTMFSPEGRLYQVEYALEAVRRGTLCIGIRCNAGAALITRKKFTTLMEPETIQKIFKIDEHIGCSISGLHADSRILVDYARVQAQVHRLSYGEPVRISTITRRLADIKQQYTQHGGVRPFGSALLIVGMDPNGTPKVMTTSPSGTFWSWEGTTMGRNSDTARDKLKDELKPEMPMIDMIKLGIKVLKESSEEEFDEETIQVAKIDHEEPVFRLLSPNEIKKYI